MKIGAKRTPIHTPAQAARAGRSDRGAAGRRAGRDDVLRGPHRRPGRPHRRAAAEERGDRRMQRALLRASCASAAPRPSPRSRRSRRAASSSTPAGPATSSCVAAEPAMTEATAGSGFYAPTLFDNYRGFTLAARPRCSRCRSSAAPGAAASSPRSAAATSPPARRQDRAADARTSRRACARPMEGAGEVQTPLRGAGRRPPARRRPRLLPPHQGRRAVRALQPPLPARGRRGSSTRCPPTAARARASCDLVPDLGLRSSSRR